LDGKRVHLEDAEVQRTPSGAEGNDTPERITTVSVVTEVRNRAEKTQGVYGTWNGRNARRSHWGTQFFI